METTVLMSDLADMSTTKDWKKAQKSKPSVSRIMNRTINLKNRNHVALLLTAGLFIVVLFYKYSGNSETKDSFYNNTYPITPVQHYNGIYTFRIGVIADLDTDSKSEKEKNTWYSYYKRGYLNYNPSKNEIGVSWDAEGPMVIKNNYALKGRGMELSELVTFDGRLLTIDDRTGLVFELVGKDVIPWVLLMDGNGKNKKGFKSEWATVKSGELYVGSIGKEWTTATGEFENHNPQYIKIVDKNGSVRHVNWVSQYERLRAVLGIKWPGYMIHESGVWSDVHQKWFFLPRRCSKETYDEVKDERRGCSVIITADSDIHDVRIVDIPNEHNTRGFSSFKFIPGTNDQVIVALRSEEIEGKTATYMTSFTVHGQILLEDVLIGDVKYEGFEFI